MSDIRIIRDFYSYPESTVRTLRVYTPDAYYSDLSGRFPVLYMLDGQNIFNHPESATYDTWWANWTMDRLIFEARIRPWIIVGIDHLPDRFAEYSPWYEQSVHAGGRGWSFIDFLTNHLKPFMDANYRTLREPHWTGILGSSLGGLLSLVVGKMHPNIFGRIGAVSPTVMWAGEKVFQLWDSPTGCWSKIYIDTGSLERYWYYDIYLDYVDAATRFHRHLKNLGLNEHELRFVLAEGHFHNEEAWKARLPDIFSWLLEDARGI